MSNDINVRQYPLDLTGENPTNRVREVMTLSPANATDYNFLVPSKAPFYHRTLTIDKIEQGGMKTRLHYGQDYYVGGQFDNLSDYIKHQRPVSGTIIFTDLEVAGNYELNYQTLGGDFVLDEQALYAEIKNRIKNPFFVNWEEILEKPIEFAPDVHKHHANELEDYSEFIEALNTLAKVIESYMERDSRDTPSYTQLVIELINQAKTIREFGNKLTNMKNTLEGSTTAQISDAVRNIQDLSRNLDTRLEEMRTGLTAEVQGEINKIKAIADGFNANAAQANENFTNLINTTLGDVNQTLSTQTQNINQTLETNLGLIDRKLQEVRTLANSIKEEVMRLVNGELEKLKIRLQEGLDGKVDKAGDTMTGALFTPELKTPRILLGREGLQTGQRPLLRVEGETFVAGKQGSDASLKFNLPAKFNYGVNISGNVPLFYRDIQFYQGGDGNNRTLVLSNGDRQDNSSSGNKRLDIFASDFVSLKNEGLKLSNRVARRGDRMEGSLYLKMLDHNYRNGFSTFDEGSYWGVYNGFKNNVGPTRFREIYIPGQAVNGYTSYVNGRTLFFKEDHVDKVYLGWYNSSGRWGGDKEIATTDMLANFVTSSQVNSFLNFQVQQETDKEDIRRCLNKVPYTRLNGEIYLGSDLVVMRNANEGASGQNLVKLAYTFDTEKSHGLKVKGYCHAKAYYIESDERLKKDIKPIENPLTLIKHLNGYTYKLKKDNRPMLGVIAQEVKAILPELTFIGKDDVDQTLSVQYDGITAILIEAVKAQQQQIELLKEEIALLKGEGK